MSNHCSEHNGMMTSSVCCIIFKYSYCVLAESRLWELCCSCASLVLMPASDLKSNLLNYGRQILLPFKL